MAYNFPDNPTVGQTVVGPGNTIYQWDGAKWIPVVGGGSSGGTSVLSFNTRTGAVTLTPTDVSGASGILNTGGSMSGPLTLAADPTANLQAATKQYVDAHGITGTIDGGTF